jgi:hypothetical protein
MHDGTCLDAGLRAAAGRQAGASPRAVAVYRLVILERWERCAVARVGR